MIEGRVVAITGASRGIGAAAARQFAAEGARVALLARNAAQIAELADGIGQDRALALPCDVADAGQMRAALHRVADHFSGLDVLVNNAGVIDPIARIADADPAEWGPPSIST